MASISRQTNGRRTIQFVGPDGKRRSIRLGKTPQKMAEEIKRRVEHLVAAHTAEHAVDRDTSAWLAKLDQTLSGKLAAVGLIPRRQVATLSSFLQDYVDGRSDVSDETKTNWGHTIRNLVAYFGSDRRLDDITRGECDSWKCALPSMCDQTARDGLSPATVSKRVKNARQFFRAAVRKELIDRNPFDDIKAGTQANAERKFYVDRTTIFEVLQACPNQEWRVIAALCRFAGFRCPSEVLALRWEDVDWDRDRLAVRKHKTKSRVVPLFPELRPYLDEAFDRAEPGAEFVVSRYRGRETNLRTQFERIIRRAGVQPWPRLFHNLRASRETELAEVYPMHVVCEWIGNSQRVAFQHYLTVTDSHYEQAVSQPTGAVQNPVQQTAADKRTESQTSHCELALVGDNAIPCNDLQEDATIREDRIVGLRGFEPPPGVNPD